MTSSPRSPEALHGLRLLLGFGIFLLGAWGALATAARVLQTLTALDAYDRLLELAPSDARSEALGSASRTMAIAWLETAGIATFHLALIVLAVGARRAVMAALENRSDSNS